MSLHMQSVGPPECLRHVVFRKEVWKWRVAMVFVVFASFSLFGWRNTRIIATKRVIVGNSVPACFHACHSRVGVCGRSLLKGRHPEIEVGE
jgi:hypothetical protein